MKILKKLIIIYSLCLIISNNNTVFAETNNDNPYLKAPNPLIYKKPSELWGTKKYDTMVTDWFVFSDQDDLKLYDSTKEQKIVKVFSFLDKFRVLKREAKHFYVESMDKSVKGWARAESLIILSHAIKTKDSITHKAVLINKIGDIKGNLNAVIPLRAPFKNVRATGKNIRILEFANIYNYYPNEENAQYILLGKRPYFLPLSKKNLSINDIMLGWVPASRVLTWDTREALQPNPKRKHPIYYFKNKQDLISYYESHADNNKYPSCKNVPVCNNNQRKDKELLVIRPDYENKIDRSPWPKKLFRYAILQSNNDITQPFEIGVSSATLNERVFKKNLTETIEHQRGHLGCRDVVFLIDATMSMGAYFKLVGKIAKDFMNQFDQEKQKNKEHGELRFGVALYRDYFNKDNCFEINKNGYLTTDEMQIKDYLDNIKPLRSYEEPTDPAYYPEAVFQGLINTIDQMNWNKGSRKLIIHIGDVGNNSRGLDSFTEKIIAQRITDNDISYCVIQLIKPSLNKDHYKAQHLMCQQTHSIIHHTASILLDIVQDNMDVNVFPKDNILHLQSLKDQSKQTGCYEIENVCNPIGKRRWLSRCIPADDQLAYQQTISEQINLLASDMYEAKSILDNIRRGNTITETDINEETDMDPKMYDSDKNISSKPFLMPGIVNSLIQEIGNELLSKKDDPAIHAKILNYIGPTRMKQINDPKVQKEIIQIIGKKELQTYINDDVNFFTKAYIYLKRPGNNFKNDPDQLIKMVLFQKNEFENLLEPLKSFREKWHCQIHPENIKEIWRGFLLAILGEYHYASDDNIDKSESIKSLYEKQFGLSLRKFHPLLNITYGDIEKGNYPQDLSALASYLCSIHKKLSKIYLDESSYFSIFGEKFFWVEASHLP